MTPFHFHTKLDLILLLGERAANLPELLKGLEKVPPASVYYHTHRFLEQHQTFSPEPPNDFAYWTRKVLNEHELGEALSSIDLAEIRTLAELQARVIGVVRDHSHRLRRNAEAPPGQEFHFMMSRTFALPSSFRAENLAEFQNALRKIDISAMQFHMFDARLRLELGENDFSRWFAELGARTLAERTRSLDPYTFTLEGLREELLDLIEVHGTN